jgi:hypothetical protein
MKNQLNDLCTNDLPDYITIVPEVNGFASSGNFTNDLLSITAVHPMRKDAVFELMGRSNANEKDFNKLIENGLIK